MYCVILLCIPCFFCSVVAGSTPDVHISIGVHSLPMPALRMRLVATVLTVHCAHVTLATAAMEPTVRNGKSHWLVLARRLTTTG